jgi:glycosyltransferase involved in cell wall biosynthesis
MPVAPKRVLYIQPNNEIGGSDIALLRLIEQLDRARYLPIVALPVDGPLSEPLRRAGAELHVLPMRQLRTVPSPGYQARYVVSLVPTIRRLCALISDRAIDLVHTNSLYCPYGAWAARFSLRPHIWHVREIPPQIPVVRALYGEMVRRLSAVVVPMTHACVDGLFGKGPIPDNVVVMPDGIDVRHWNPDISGERVRRELGLSATTPVIGFVARLDPWKGVEIFLRAARQVVERVPDAHFLIVGDAPVGFERYRDGMVSLSGSLGLAKRVHFLGWRYRLSDIPEVMAALTVLCHTPVRPEPFGLVAIEAMAVGCPVIAPLAGGPAEIVQEDVTGYLVPPGKTEAFADRICRLIQDPECRARMSFAGREHVIRKYSSERFARRLAELYARVFSGEFLGAAARPRSAYRPARD